MTVTFYGRVIEYTDGEKSFTSSFDFSDSNGCPLILRQLIDELCCRYGEGFSLFVHGNETCLILLNGRGIALSGGLDSPLTGSDKVEILPFVDAG